MLGGKSDSGWRSYKHRGILQFRGQRYGGWRAGPVIVGETAVTNMSGAGLAWMVEFRCATYAEGGAGVLGDGRRYGSRR